MAELQTGDGRRISYDTTGHGPPVLLLMGAGESRRLWANQTAALAGSFHVITMDHRDSGESDSEDSPYGLTDLASDACALLDGLGVTRTHVVGTSMGSMVGLQLALDHPARVDRLVLLAPLAGGLHLAAPPREAWSPDHADWMRGMFPLLASPGFFDTHPEVLEEAVRIGRENRLTYDGAVRQLGAMASFDARSRLGEIAAPALLVQGEHDPFLTPADARAFAEALPRAQLVIVPGAGHLAFLEQPEAVNDIILRFLRA
jgi:3-oxoadipate enol-lactonase